MARGDFKGPLDYIDVATRIVEFRDKYPTGSLVQQSLDFRTFAGKDWVVYTAAAYRTPDDERPGVGTAWEPVPGTTSFTRDSELQNAETAAWGRAMVAALAVDTRKGIASQEEVRNRQAEPKPDPKAIEQAIAGVKTAVAEGSIATMGDARQQWLRVRALGATVDQLDDLAKTFTGLPDPAKADA